MAIEKLSCRGLRLLAADPLMFVSIRAVRAPTPLRLIPKRQVQLYLPLRRSRPAVRLVCRLRKKSSSPRRL